MNTGTVVALIIGAILLLGAPLLFFANMGDSGSQAVQTRVPASQVIPNNSSNRSWNTSSMKNWENCLRSQGIWDKCRVQGNNVECRQSVAHIAAKCGI